MGDVTPLTGKLQVQVTATLWRLGSATVDQVRGALPPRYRGAYTTTQTVLNRLVDRGLLSRHRVGSSFAYRPLIAEDEYLSRAISQILAGASMSVGSDALARLIDELDDDELRAVRDLAQDMRRGLRSR